MKAFNFSNKSLAAGYKKSEALANEASVVAVRWNNIKLDMKFLIVFAAAVAGATAMSGPMKVCISEK